jgi:hypothetical protein
VSTRRPLPGRLTVSRDSLSFLGGWYLIIFQAQFAHTFNLAVFLGGMTLAGVPGALAVLSAWSGTRMAGSSSDSPQEASREG